MRRTEVRQLLMNSYMIMEALNIKGFIKMALLMVNGFTFMIMEIFGLWEITIMVSKQVYGPPIIEIDKNGPGVIIQIMKEAESGFSIMMMEPSLKRKSIKL